MPKPPLSPSLHDPHAALPDAGPRRHGCRDHALPAGQRGVMALGSAELFVVATLRAWVAPLMRPAATHPDWRELVHLAAIGTAGAMAFDALMSLIAAEARRLIDVHCCPCPALGDDEAAMLGLVSALQSGETAAARAVLGDWLPDGAVERALPAARCFALAVAEAGLALPRPAAVLAVPPGQTVH